jgi:FkbM family methyltransferase
LGKIKSSVKNLAKKFGIDIYYYGYKFRIGKEFDEVSVVFNVLYEQQKNGVMLDVGSHFGESAIPFLMNGWAVFSFEPDVSIDKKNRLSLLAKQFSKFQYFNFAISDKDNEDVEFYSNPESTGISSIIPFTNEHRKIATVKTKTLKTFLNEQGKGISAIDFLKIDTEGNDLFVLQGFPFNKIKPDLIVCEFEDSKTQQVGYGYKQLGDLLVKQGYTVLLSEWYPINRYGGNHQWKRIKEYPCDLDDEKGWGNFIAFKKSYENNIYKVLNEKFNIEI